MSGTEILIAAFLALGAFFYLAGTVGLLRFPDTHSRLHALTKADNLGLGFILIAAGLHWGDIWITGKLFLIWLLALFAAGMAAQLVARAALKAEEHE